MEIFKIIGVALVTCVAGMIVKQAKPEISVIVFLTGGIIILLMLVDYINEILTVFTFVADKTGLSDGLIGIVFKVIGIGYLSEFAANICTDSGSASLGDKVLLGGKIIIFAMSLPIITNIINIVVELLA